MSLSESLGELSQKVQQQEKAKEEKAFSGIRKNITHLEKDKKELNTASSFVKDSYGLAGDALTDYKMTMKKINGLFEENKDLLKKVKIEDKWSFINDPKFQKDAEIKDLKEKSQELRKTVGQVIESKNNLKGRGIEATARKFYPGEVKNKSKELDKEIEGLKLQTPEGQEERRQEFKNGLKVKLEEKAWGLRFQDKIDNANLVPTDFFKEAKKFGEGGEKIVKETIIEVFHEKNEKIKSLQELNKEFKLINDFKRIISPWPGLEDKLKNIENLAEKLPKILAKEFEKNKKLSSSCIVFFSTDNSYNVLRQSFFHDYLGGNAFANWLSNAKSLTNDLKNNFNETLSSDRVNFIPDARAIAEDAEKMFVHFQSLEGDIGGQLSLYMEDVKENLYGDKKKEKNSISSIKNDLEKIYEKRREESQYKHKLSQDIKDSLHRKSFDEAEKEAKNKLGQAENKLLASLDFYWLKEEKNLFENEKGIWEIENNVREINERKEKAKKFLINFREIENNLKDRSEEKVKAEKNIERWNRDKEVHRFISIEGMNNRHQLNEEITALKTKIETTSNQIIDLKDNEPRAIGKKEWNKKLNNLEEQNKKLNEDQESWDKKNRVQNEKDDKLKDLSQILQDLSLGKEFIDKDLTMGEVLRAFRDKLNFIQFEEKLPQEKQVIYNDWQTLTEKIKLAEDKYKKAKEELPDF